MQRSLCADVSPIHDGGDDDCTWVQQVADDANLLVTTLAPKGAHLHVLRRKTMTETAAYDADAASAAAAAAWTKSNSAEEKVRRLKAKQQRQRLRAKAQAEHPQEVGWQARAYVRTT